MAELAQPEQRTWTWDNKSEEAVYKDVVGDCLTDPEVRRHLGLRDTATEEEVRRGAYAPGFIAQAIEASYADYVWYRHAMRVNDRAQQRLQEAQAHRVIDRVGRGLIAVVVFLPFWWFLSDRIAGERLRVWGSFALLGTAMALGTLIVTHQQLRLHAKSVFDVALPWRYANRGLRLAAIAEQTWFRSLKEAGVLPQMRILAKNLLGNDRDSLLTTERGNTFHDRHYVVEATAEQQLRQKMAQIDGGAIAVCGPRGVGKSTLLRACTRPTRPADVIELSVMVAAPAEYDPKDFLVTLLGEVCLCYLRNFGRSTATFGMPSFVELHHGVRRVVQRIRWLAPTAVAVVVFAAALTRPSVLFYRSVGRDTLNQLGELWQLAYGMLIGLPESEPWILGLTLAAIGLGFLLQPRRSPDLMERECLRILYRLRTVQSSSSGLNLGTSLLSSLALGASRTTELSSSPVTLPELVTEFRELLAKIAKELRGHKGRVVIAIDELDRVGDGEQARSFLGHITAIFGIENVYYLVAVAEDIGATFARRGVPYRDVAGSAFEDQIYLRPRTLKDAAEVLRRREQHLTSPFVHLVHALSGGLPKDLIRYARRLFEVHHWTSRVELTDLAPRMICDELADALEGLRTLLAARERTAAGGQLLNSLYRLVHLLHSPYEPNAVDIKSAIQGLAENPTPSASDGSAVFSDDALALWEEASAYGYFFLTMLEVFGEPYYDQRSAEALKRGPGGDAQLLADARQEVTISMQSARILLSEVRDAWSLAPLSG